MILPTSAKYISLQISPRDLEDWLFDDTFPLRPEEFDAVWRVDNNGTACLWQPDWLVTMTRGFRSVTSAEAVAARTAAIAATQQTPGPPRHFLRYIDQLRPELFPVQRLCSLDRLFGSGILDAAGLPDAEEQVVREIYWNRRFEQIRQWFLNLPLKEDEPVYVALQPDFTLVLPWRLFVDHWDTFYHTFSALNIVDDDPRWFLFLHPEEVAIWGSTEDRTAGVSDYDPTKSSVEYYGSRFKKLKRQDWERSKSFLQRFLAKHRGPT